MVFPLNLMRKGAGEIIRVTGVKQKKGDERMNKTITPHLEKVSLYLFVMTM